MSDFPQVDCGGQRSCYSHRLPPLIVVARLVNDQWIGR